MSRLAKLRKLDIAGVFFIDNRWWDNLGQVIDKDSNGKKTLWELVKAIDEVRSKKVQSIK